MLINGNTSTTLATNGSNKSQVSPEIQSELLPDVEKTSEHVSPSTHYLMQPSTLEVATDRVGPAMIVDLKHGRGLTF